MSECTCNLFTMTRTHAKLCFSEAKSSKYKNKDIRYTYNLSSTTRTHQIYLKKESAYLTIICETAVFCALVCRGTQSLSNSHNRRRKCKFNSLSAIYFNFFEGKY